MDETVFTPALKAVEHVKSEKGEILTKPFLEMCKNILPVLDKFGSAMSLVKNDIGGNITRLETKYASDPSKYNLLYSVVQEEIENKTAKGSSSSTNGLLWLTRAMDYLVELFRNLIVHPEWSMSHVCTDSYGKTLKKWHGWLASSSFTVRDKTYRSLIMLERGKENAYFTVNKLKGRVIISCFMRLLQQFTYRKHIIKVAMKLAPDRKKFMEVIGGTGNLNADMEKFCSSFSPFLEENHNFLASVGFDNMKAS